jgi:hypothetical protein
MKSQPYDKGRNADAQPAVSKKSRLHDPVLPNPERRIEIVANEIAEIIPVQRRAA